ncbi:autotransporter outer membrane beta-barrel domain-containing protein [Novosphingobium sp. FSY-8]|uniref:Autotransporter outer membrane beta-barrel domain-containing protein n=1 Tax=Novosphingobium ovatum TaxID=1908523 RepID=A0ABW9XAT1_9SPHN|nr:autotransporter outer membrane beta-barrel domain-containing protein [Novosphingobium ovatum]NBC35638.1 autotransporter outer membrane beta-barrel domain-containing protein [Novosphingobium ovatum]
MRGVLRLMAGAVALIAAPAFAQTTDGGAADLGTTTEPIRMWSAEVSGGYASRDDGPKGAFAVTGLTRQIGRYYVRAALTTYRSTAHQLDMALPSTYVVGTLGAGGNINNWVFDGWISYGRQIYGQIDTGQGTRASTNGTGAPYWAVGGDFGRILPLGRDWYLTPTVMVNYAYDRLLRPSPDLAYWADYQSREATVSGAATLRLDKRIGPDKQHLIGVAAGWHVSNNGLSILIPPEAGSGGAFDTRHYTDGWAQIGANASLRLNARARLEGSVTRSIGAAAGDATSVSAGLRIAF